jgi:hypothetical protein
MGIAPLERIAMKMWVLIFAAIALAAGTAKAAETNLPTVILVVGAPGEPEYGSNFVQQVRLWDDIAKRAEARVIRIGQNVTNAVEDRGLLKETLTRESAASSAPLWLVLIGHGTFDGKEARFNLRGPDVSSSELAESLKPVQRPLLVIHCASASAPFMKALAGTNRVVITATRSGSEMNFARFGEYFAKALADSGSDLDKDGQVSLLESFLVASRHVTEFYKTEGRLVTEHALLDDNGDGLGTPADWFRGVRATKKAKDGASHDGGRANQFCLVLSPEEQALPPEVRARRNALELEVTRLRQKKDTMSEADYYQQLEGMLLELARLQAEGSTATNAPAH